MKNGQCFPDIGQKRIIRIGRLEINCLVVLMILKHLSTVSGLTSWT